MLITLILLYLIYLKTKKFNNIAVLIGAIGYLLIYIALINKAIISNLNISIILYAFAILIYLMLVGIGLKANLKDARVHWVIEISNIICQSLVAISTIILFK